MQELGQLKIKLDINKIPVQIKDKLVSRYPAFTRNIQN